MLLADSDGGHRVGMPTGIPLGNAESSNHRQRMASKTPLKMVKLVIESVLSWQICF
jgi:hypothetical protein